MDPQTIENAIMNQTLGAGTCFLDYPWLVPYIDGEPWALKEESGLFPRYHLFTRPERAEPFLKENQAGKEFQENPYPLTTPDGWNVIPPRRYESAVERWELRPVTGRELFPVWAGDGTYHEIVINAECGTYEDPHRDGAMLIPCGWTPLLARGLDPRPQTRTLTARSFAEIHLFMQRHHLVLESEHRLDYDHEGTLIAVFEGLDLRGKPVQQGFFPGAAIENPLCYGPGPSEILCAGLLAYGMKTVVWNVHNNFHPATRQNCFESMPESLRLLDDVLKMLDPETDRLPPKSLRYPATPGFIKAAPEVVTGAWLRQTREEFERFLREYPSETPR